MDRDKLKTLRNIAAAILLVSAVVYAEVRFGPHGAVASGKGYGWNTDLAAALKSSAKSGKPVLVDFNATWCGPCRDYEEEIFPTAEFRKVASKFELVSVDIDLQPQVAAKYGVSPIPDIRFLDGTGKDIAKPVVGYVGDELIMYMQLAIAGRPHSKL
jgi:thiol-disulfide isomerase/thioredoxin